MLAGNADASYPDADPDATVNLNTDYADSILLYVSELCPCPFVLKFNNTLYKTHGELV